MHKRARNHKSKVYCNKADKFYRRNTTLDMGFSTYWKMWSFGANRIYGMSRFNYEPQGRREGRKYELS